MLVSPDTEDLLEAISILKNGASIVPEDLDGTVSQMISAMGGDAIRMCAGKSSDFKRGFLICYAYCNHGFEKPRSSSKRN